MAVGAEDTVEADLACGAERGGDVAVRQAAGDLERPVQVRGGQRLASRRLEVTSVTKRDRARSGLGSGQGWRHHRR
jgi:hypothetical protein